MINFLFCKCVNVSAFKFWLQFLARTCGLSLRISIIDVHLSLFSFLNVHIYTYMYVYTRSLALSFFPYLYCLFLILPPLSLFSFSSLFFKSVPLSPLSLFFNFPQKLYFFLEQFQCSFIKKVQRKSSTIHRRTIQTFQTIFQISIEI